MPNQSPNYTNRELDEKLDNITDIIERNRLASKEQLDRIEAQTIKTNGRVTQNSNDITTLKQFQSYAVGFSAAVSLLILPIIFILISRAM